MLYSHPDPPLSHPLNWTVAVEFSEELFAIIVTLVFPRKRSAQGTYDLKRSPNDPVETTYPAMFQMPEWFTARDPTTVNNHGAVDHQEVAPALLKRHRERNTQWSAENFETVLTGAASATPGSKERRVTNRQRGRMTLGRFMIDMSSRHPEGEVSEVWGRKEEERRKEGRKE